MFSFLMNMFRDYIISNQLYYISVKRSILLLQYGLKEFSKIHWIMASKFAFEKEIALKLISLFVSISRRKSGFKSRLGFTW